MSTESRPVVAVFGRNGADRLELQAAQWLGAILAERAIVLTGSSRPRLGSSNIKDVAAAAADGELNTQPGWIGVARSSAARPSRRLGRGIVVAPGGDDKRNFVEACLCDAAIAIGDSTREEATEGTSSEALFSLFLRRPVLLIGISSSEHPSIQMRLLTEAVKKVKMPDPPQSPVETGIALAYAWARSPDVGAEHASIPRTEANARALVDGLSAKLGTTDRKLSLEELEKLDGERQWDGLVTAELRQSGRLPSN